MSRPDLLTRPDVLAGIRDDLNGLSGATLTALARRSLVRQAYRSRVRAGGSDWVLTQAGVALRTRLRAEQDQARAETARRTVAAAARLTPWGQARVTNVWPDPPTAPSQVHLSMSVAEAEALLAALSPEARR